MPLPHSIAIPPAGINFTFNAGQTTILVGANGSGKSRLAAWLENNLGMDAHRIGAHRVLTLNPDVAKVSEATSLNTLRTGVGPGNEANESYFLGWRPGHRWGSKPTTHLLNDFDAVLQALYAQQNNIAVQTHADVHAGFLYSPRLTNFQRLVVIWQRVMPTRRLIITADNIRVEVVGSAPGREYSAEALSDGERAVFYMIGQVLFALPGSVLIFDEPELHVHRAILGKLWDELEAARSDCAFVLVTHDLEFAATRSGIKMVVRAFTEPDQWDVEPIPADTGFDEELTTLILGSRQPVLFVEGDGSSLDLAIYRACYPSWTVIARGGCQQVIHSVATMRANASLTRVTCAGLIDADSRDAFTTETLDKYNVAVLPVSEIENLFALPTVASAILAHDSFTPEQQAERLEQLTTRLLSDAAKPDTLTSVVVDQGRRLIDQLLKAISFEDAVDEADLAAKFQQRTGALDVNALAGAIRSRLEKAITDRNLTELLKLYDKKEQVLATTASALRGTRMTEFVGWVARVMKDPDKPSLRDAVTAVLPQVTAS
jgi:energy-coupling factor transporter ATP-binding protein EcfA2